MKHLLAALVVALAAPVSAGTFGPYSELLVFGDSLSDPGNKAKLTDNTSPNPDFYPKRQFTNGDTWAKQLGADIGTNFAYGDARATENGDEFPDFSAQVDLFKAALADTDSPLNVGDNPLAAVWFGGNDLRDLSNDVFAALATTPDQAEFFKKAKALADVKAVEIAASIAGGVGRLAAETGLEDFLVFLAPDLSTIPALVDSDFAPLFLEVVNGTNLAIQFFVDQVAAAIPTINVEYFDPNLVAANILAAPAAFGLDPEKTKSQCLSTAGFCGLENASDYYFFDDIHPTEKVHTVLAEAVRAQVVPLPGGLSLALGGFALLGFAARRKRAA